jgi:hypothetical protein
MSLETCRGRKINTLKKVKKVLQVGCKSRIPKAVSDSLNELEGKWKYIRIFLYKISLKPKDDMKTLSKLAS